MEEVHRRWGFGIGTFCAISLLGSCEVLELDLSQLEDPALVAKFTALSQQEKIRLAHEKRGGNPTLLGVKVVAEERRPSGAAEALGSLNPLTPKITEDIRYDSDLVVEFEESGAEKRLQTLEKALGQCRAAFAKPADALATLTVTVSDEPDAPKRAALAQKRRDDLAKKLDAGNTALGQLEKWVGGGVVSVDVAVRAFLTPKDKQRTQIHVENYYTIAAGSAASSAGSSSAPSPDPLATPQKYRLGRADAVRTAQSAIPLVRAMVDAAEAVSVKNPEDRLDKALKALRKHADDLVRMTLEAEAAGGSNPPPGVIHLDKLSAKHGDSLSLEVIVTRTVNGQTESEATTYLSRLVKVGVYPLIGGSLIFARGEHGFGSAKDWKANAAASLEWHYRTLFADDALEAFWNWLDPGVGIHVASVDQDDTENAELGIGVNASVWGGFLQGGIGYNLSVDRDHTYFYFGVDLLSVLRKTQADNNQN